MRWSFLLFLLLGLPGLSTALGGDASPAWSQPVKGLRARLFTAPSHEPELDKTFDVWIEFEEVGIDTSLGLSHQKITIRFEPSQFAPQVTDATGGAPSQQSWPGNFMTEAWDLVLPPNGRIAFPIGHGGSRPDRSASEVTPSTGKLLQLEPLSGWLIPPAGGPFYLSGFFDAPYSVSHSLKFDGFKISMVPQPPEHLQKPYRGWQGTLVLPPIEIPQN